MLVFQKYVGIGVAAAAVAPVLLWGCGSKEEEGGGGDGDDNTAAAQAEAQRLISDSLYSNFAGTETYRDQDFVVRSYNATIAEIVAQLDKAGADGEKTVADALKKWKPGDPVPAELNTAITALVAGLLPLRDPTWVAADQDRLLEIRQTPAVAGTKEFIFDTINECWKTNEADAVPIVDFLYDGAFAYFLASHGGDLDKANNVLSTYVYGSTDSKYQAPPDLITETTKYLTQAEAQKYIDASFCPGDPDAPFDQDAAMSALISDGLYKNYPADFTDRDTAFVAVCLAAVKTELSVYGSFAQEQLDAWTNAQQETPSYVTSIISMLLRGLFTSGAPFGWRQADVDKLKAIVDLYKFDTDAQMLKLISDGVYKNYPADHERDDDFLARCLAAVKTELGFLGTLAQEELDNWTSAEQDTPILIAGVLDGLLRQQYKSGSPPGWLQADVDELKSILENGAAGAAVFLFGIGACGEGCAKCGSNNNSCDECEPGYDKTNWGLVYHCTAPDTDSKQLLISTGDAVEYPACKDLPCHEWGACELGPDDTMEQFGTCDGVLCKGCIPGF